MHTIIRLELAPDNVSTVSDINYNVNKTWSSNHLTKGITMEEEIGTCDEGGNRSSPAPEEPLGILQLIDQLENIVDTLVPR